MSALFASLLASFRSRATLQIEILALRHQLGILQRSVKRPKLTVADRQFWAWLSQVWSDWRDALVIVRPETVIAWHRKGFRLFWTWKVRHGRRGLCTRGHNSNSNEIYEMHRFQRGLAISTAPNNVFTSIPPLLLAV